MTPHVLSIPFTRNDQDGDQNTRALATTVYAIGLAGGDLAMTEACSLLIGVHDHKGGLEVRSSASLSPILQRAFRKAWQDIGSEPSENVEFIVEDPIPKPRP